MTDYAYTRTSTAGVWDINNPNDVDGDNVSVTLAQRIKEDATVGPYLQKVVLNDTSVTVIMSQALTAGEETTLDGIVAAHKAAAGTPTQVTTQVWTSADGTRYNVCVNNAGVVETSAE